MSASRATPMIQQTRTMRASVCCCLFVVWLSYDTSTAKSVPDLLNEVFPEPCQPVNCGLYCAYGFAADGNGCDFCACKNPCEDFECPPDRACLVATARCIRGRCPTYPVCEIIIRESPILEDQSPRKKRSLRQPIGEMMWPVPPNPGPWQEPWPMPGPWPRPGPFWPNPQPWPRPGPWAR
ncbi:hypothetical protein LSAT2_013213 [Lamellibrachia satsuma]|nr:hypothetical protein LSAT2_013213 [Lamellibrachia satsuma]